ncbi:hypothetical protein BH11PLA1_BH11PLA1_03670 [soil metagenome]
MPMPILLLLTQTLRAARARPAHVFRACAYALLPVSLLLWTQGATYFLEAVGQFLQLDRRRRVAWTDNLYDFFLNYREAVAALGVAWLLLYWFSFLKFGLRTRQPRATAAILLFTSLLIALIILCLSGRLDWTILNLHWY